MKYPENMLRARCLKQFSSEARMLLKSRQMKIEAGDERKAKVLQLALLMSEAGSNYPV